MTKSPTTVLTSPFEEQTPEQMFTNWEKILRFVSRSTKRNGRMIAALVVSLALDIALTAGIWATAVHLHDVTVQAQRTSCVSGNQFRHDEKQLWLHVLDITSPAKPTTAEEHARAEFVAYLNVAMESRNCKTVN